MKMSEIKPKVLNSYVVKCNETAAIYNAPNIFEYDIDTVKKSSIKELEKQVEEYINLHKQNILSSLDMSFFDIINVEFDVGSYIQSVEDESFDDDDDEDHGSDNFKDVFDKSSSGAHEMSYSFEFKVSVSGILTKEVAIKIAEAVGVIIWGQYGETGNEYSNVEIKKFVKN